MVALEFLNNGNIGVFGSVLGDKSTLRITGVVKGILLRLHILGVWLLLLLQPMTAAEGQDGSEHYSLISDVAFVAWEYIHVYTPHCCVLYQSSHYI